MKHREKKSKKSTPCDKGEKKSHYRFGLVAFFIPIETTFPKTKQTPNR